MQIPSSIPIGLENETIQKWVQTLPEAQLLWLSGYFYGLATAKTVPNSVNSKVEIPKITILYGTQSGNAKKAAKSVAAKIQTRGWQSELVDMNEYPTPRLKSDKILLVVVSTYGEGEPPAAAETLHQLLHGQRAPKFTDLDFSILSLGDKSYLQFCQTGIDFDVQLSKLGGRRLANRVDCDVDFHDDSEKWGDAVVAAIAQKYESATAQTANSFVKTASSLPSIPKFDRKNPFGATVLEKIQLNGRGSDRETYHLELSLENSGLTYQAGDSLGILPTNSERLVSEVLKKTGFAPATALENQTANLGEFLLNQAELSVLNLDLLKKYADLTQNEALKTLLLDKKQLQTYCYGRDVVDLLTDFPAQNLTPQAFAALLRNMPARLYSISSSLEMYPDEVHLTIGAVRYQSFGRKKEGVCSSFMADRLAIGEKANVFVENNEFFKIPKNPDTPIIMIGAGTGIAPFRAFVQERQTQQARGKNWLIFGNPHFTTDFLYQLEWQQALKKGHLAQLDVAFSRDQAAKVYVQHRLLEKSKQVFDWLEQGAHFYVCGDKNRMAGDVERALVEVVQQNMASTPEKAIAYVKQLKQQRRYLEDVY